MESLDSPQLATINYQCKWKPNCLDKKHFLLLVYHKYYSALTTAEVSITCVWRKVCFMCHINSFDV